MRIATNTKEIPTGSFYVKLDKFYIYDSKPVVLEYLTDLFSQRKSNVYMLKLRDKYFVFLIEKDKLRIKEKTSIDEILLLYPNAVIKEDKYLKKIKPKVKGFVVNKKQLIAFPILLLTFTSLFVLYKKKQLNEQQEKLRQMAIQEEERRRQMQMQQQQVVYKPVCKSNLKSFLANYLPYSVIEDGTLRVKVKDTTYNIPLNEEETEPISIDKIVMPSTKSNIQIDNEGYRVNIQGYYNCIGFISLNKDIPMKIRRLNNETQQQSQSQQNQPQQSQDNTYNCDIVIPFDCIKPSTTTINTTATNTATTTTNTTTATD